MNTELFDRIKTNCPVLSVGAISADMMALGKDLKTLEENGVRFLHIDVMDGRFAPPITVGSAFVKAMKTTMFKDVHLMIEEPLEKLDDFAAAGADMITVHVESSRHPHHLLQRIGELKNANDPARGILRGIALNPGTPLCSVKPLLDSADLVFLLAVNPGFPRQKFIESIGSKFASLKEMVRGSDRHILTGIDGGITKSTIGTAVSWGADIIVTGSAVFENGIIRDNLNSLLEIIKAKKQILI